MDGLKIHSTVTGTGWKTVVLVHGYTCDETSWAEQVPALAKEYRVVTLDLPGHGRSDSPEDSEFSMDLFACAVESVRAEVGTERVVLVGHSMGTLVALRYAHLYPERVAALVFVDGVMPISYEEAIARPNLGATMAGPEGRAKRAEAVRRYFVAGTSQEVQDKVSQMMLGTAEATAVGAMNARRDPAGQTREIPRVPALGIYADNSRIASEEAVHAAFPWVEYVSIQGTGHFLMMERPEEFNQLLMDFLAKQRF